MDATTVPPAPINEPNLTYAPGSPEREALLVELEKLERREKDLKAHIGGRRKAGGGAEMTVVQPHDHQHVLGRFKAATPADARAAIKAAGDAAPGWRALDMDERCAVLLRAAELLAGPWRQRINAAMMLGQSKTAFQAEIDSACELIDFWRYNVHYAKQILTDQPIANSPGIWNRTDHRPLEGFVFAVSPFNFTAIAGNLPTAPALMGNTVVFKPASTAVYSAHFLMKIYEEAGLPPGVINMVLGSGREIGDPVLAHPDLAGIHFTGSTGVFQGMWKTVAQNIDSYRTYPRLVGETGGKDFIFAHPSADPAAVVTAVVRGGFEYQGQKCSAASRVYAPSNLWPEMREALAEQVSEIKMGDVRDFRNFMGAVIDKPSFATQKEAVELATGASDASVVVGGETDDSKGWFVSPTVVETSDPAFDLMRRELFGPVVTAYVYDEKRVDDTLDLVDATSRYALTGAVFATDRRAIEHAATALRNAAGNFYVNDKPTGAVVGQQPFGGARASGTNDKAGSMWNLIRWVSPRTIKETFVPPTDYRYPFMSEE